MGMGSGVSLPAAVALSVSSRTWDSSSVVRCWDWVAT